MPKYAYPGLKGNLSRSHLNRTILALLIMLWQLYTAYSSINEYTTELRTTLLDICQSMEQTVSQLLESPSSFARRTNESVIRLFNFSMVKIIDVLANTIELVGGLLIWFVSVVQALFRCWFESVVGVFLDFIRKNVEVIRRGVDAVTEVTEDVINGVSGFGSGLVNSLAKVFANRDNVVPTRTVDFNADLSALEEFERMLRGVDLSRLSWSGEDADEWMMKPFRAMADALRDRVSSFSIDARAFNNTIPVFDTPEICREMDLKVVDEIAEFFKMILIICMSTLGIWIIISIAINFRMTYSNHQWKTRNVQKELSETNADRDSNQVAMRNLLQRVQHPLATRCIDRLLPQTIKESSLEKNVDSDHSIKVKRWILYYIMHQPSWLCIAMGILGISTATLQSFALHQVQTKYLPQVHQNLQSFSNKTISEITTKIQLFTGSYINQTNQAINETENAVNNQVFRPIYEAADSANMTIIQGANTAISLLEGIPFLLPIIGRLSECVVVDRTDSLTELMKRVGGLRIEIPRLEPDLISLNLSLIGGSMRQLQEKAIGLPVYDGVRIVSFEGGRIGRILKSWEGRIREQLIFGVVSAGFGSLIFVQALIAYFIISADMHKK